MTMMAAIGRKVMLWTAMIALGLPAAAQEPEKKMEDEARKAVEAVWLQWSQAFQGGAVHVVSRLERGDERGIT